MEQMGANILERGVLDNIIDPIRKLPKTIPPTTRAQVVVPKSERMKKPLVNQSVLPWLPHNAGVRN